eukprot:6191194-Pleurochrysis_carterae.AAC.8
MSLPCPSERALKRDVSLCHMSPAAVVTVSPASLCSRTSADIGHNGHECRFLSLFSSVCEAPPHRSHLQVFSGLVCECASIDSESMYGTCVELRFASRSRSSSLPPPLRILTSRTSRFLVHPVTLERSLGFLVHPVTLERSVGHGGQLAVMPWYPY